jgi:hypothetical protein
VNTTHRGYFRASLAPLPVELQNKLLGAYDDAALQSIRFTNRDLLLSPPRHPVMFQADREAATSLHDALCLALSSPVLTAKSFFRIPSDLASAVIAEIARAPSTPSIWLTSALHLRMLACATKREYPS